MKLSERLLAGEGPDRKLDVEIFQAIELAPPFQYLNKLIALSWHEQEQAYFAQVSDDMRVRYEPPRFTASLDAALSLYPTKPDTMPTNPRKAAAEALKQRGL